MQVQFEPASRVERPAFTGLGAVIEVLTGLLAIPVGISFMASTR